MRIRPAGNNCKLGSVSEFGHSFSVLRDPVPKIRQTPSGEEGIPGFWVLQKEYT